MLPGKGVRELDHVVREPLTDTDYSHCVASMAHWLVGMILRTALVARQLTDARLELAVSVAYNVHETNVWRLVVVEKTPAGCFAL